MSDGGGQGQKQKSLLPAAENLVTRVSLFDGYTDRCVVLSERIGCQVETDGETGGKSSQQHHCRFPFFDQHVEFAAHFKFYSSMIPMTVQVVPTVVCEDGTEKREPALGNSVLAWWRFFEICLTGTNVGMEGGVGGVGRGATE